jgi:DNA polymerase III epsilon subunit-like protein
LSFRETQVLALDCERILTCKGERLARVSIVNYYGNVVFDTLVRPTIEVFDYREWITGIKPLDLKYAPSYPKIAPIVIEFRLTQQIFTVVKENSQWKDRGWALIAR